jgi:hypothetical protein
MACRSDSSIAPTPSCGDLSHLPPHLDRSDGGLHSVGKASLQHTGSTRVEADPGERGDLQAAFMDVEVKKSLAEDLSML